MGNCPFIDGLPIKNGGSFHGHVKKLIPIRIHGASPGGNDNKLCIWSLKSTEPVLKFTQHQAAVKVEGDPGWAGAGVE
jgi:hypothetical protein